MSTTKIKLTTDGILRSANEIDERMPSIQDGLVDHYPFDGNAKSIVDHNMIPYDGWVIGSTGSQTGFSQNGDGNSIVLDKDPFGNKVAIWQSLNNDTASDADGGMVSTPNNTIDNTKLYRMSVWIQRRVLGDGSWYFGMNGYGTTNGVYYNTNGTTLSTNPYFHTTSGNNILGKWVLLVGHIHPHDWTNTSNHVDTGAWGIDKSKLFNLSRDFRWHTDTTTARFRSYLYYSTDPTTHQLWAYPRFDLCDGSEPTLEDLLSGANGDGGVRNPIDYRNCTENFNGITVSRTSTNIIPSPEVNSFPTYGNTHGTCGTNQYNSNTDFSIGTVGSVSSNIVTLSTVDHPIYTYDTLRPATTGGGVTAGVHYFIKKWSDDSFSLHAYNSSQDGSQGYVVDGKGFKVHESIWTDTRIAINATSFPTNWHSGAHMPNGVLVKEIIPNGYKGLHDCIRCHAEHTPNGTYAWMAYNVRPSVTVDEYYTFSFEYRDATGTSKGKVIRLQLYTGGGWTGDMIPFTIVDREWHKYTFTAKAPATGDTNLYFRTPLHSTIDISRIQCTHMYYDTAFTSSSYGTNYLQIKIGEEDGIDIDNDPLTFILKVKPENPLPYLGQTSQTVNGHSYDWCMLMDMITDSGGRFDLWWARTSDGSAGTHMFWWVSGDTVGGSAKYTGPRNALPTDDIYLIITFDGYTTTVFAILNGQLNKSSRIRTGDVGYLHSIKFGNNYLGSNILQQCSIYDRILSDDEILKYCNSHYNNMSDGTIITRAIEEAPIQCDDVVSFDFGSSATDRLNKFSPITETGVLYEDDSVWIGSALTNTVLNDGQSSSPWGGDGSPTVNQIDSEVTFRGKKVIRYHCGTSHNAYLSGSSDLSTGTDATNWSSTIYLKREDGLPITSIGSYMYVTNNTNVNITVYPEYVGDGWWKVTRERTGLSSGHPTLVGMYGMVDTTDYFIANWQVEPYTSQTAYCFPSRVDSQLKYGTLLTDFMDLEEGTMGVWFKPSGRFFEVDSWNRIFGHSTAVDKNEIQVKRRSTNSNLVMSVSNNAGNPQTSWSSVPSANLSKDEWYCVIARWSLSDGTMSLTVNDVKNQQTLTSTYIPTAKGSIGIGYHQQYSNRISNGFFRNFFIAKESLSDEICTAFYRNKLSIHKTSSYIQNDIQENEYI